MRKQNDGTKGNTITHTNIKINLSFFKKPDLKTKSTKETNGRDSPHDNQRQRTKRSNVQNAIYQKNEGRGEPIH